MASGSHPRRLRYWGQVRDRRALAAILAHLPGAEAEKVGNHWVIRVPHTDDQ